MEIPKYIQNKINQQIEACRKAAKLESEIDNWCTLSGFDPYSKKYKDTKGKLSEAVAPIDAEKLKAMADEIDY